MSAEARMIMERPILFSAPMVRAILDGKKTQTRRVMKPQPLVILHDNGKFLKYSERNDADAQWRFCPYGVSGDRLWVKETFHYDNAEYVNRYRACPFLGMPDRDNAQTYYRASEKNPDIFPRWKPSIFMPRWASRITLEITGVGANRLNDISNDDAQAEGIPPQPPKSWLGGGWREAAAFAPLWESINGRGSWALNPWVWVISFKCV